METEPTNSDCTSRKSQDASLLLVEDNHFLRDVIKGIFHAAGIDCILESATIAAARSILRNDTVDVVLLDLRLPDGNGLDFLAEIHKAENPPPVVIYSYQHSVPLLVRCFRFGASGYFTKGENKNSLVAGVLQAAAGEELWTPEQMKQIAELESLLFDKHSNNHLSVAGQ